MGPHIVSSVLIRCLKFPRPFVFVSYKSIYVQFCTLTKTTNICIFQDTPQSISADPGLSQGRGGAWDHRRCGTTALFKATQACRVAQTLPGSVHKLLKPHHSAFRAQGCRLPSIKTPKPFPRLRGSVHGPVKPPHCACLPANASEGTAFSPNSSPQCHSILLLGRSRVRFARLQNPPNLSPGLSEASTSQSSHRICWLARKLQ